MSHTPTPWAVDENYPTTIIQVAGDGSILECEFMEWDGENMNVGAADLNEANAAFIVKAVNAHADLVGFVQEIADMSPSAFERGDNPAFLIDAAKAALKALSLSSAERE